MELDSQRLLSPEESWTDDPILKRSRDRNCACHSASHRPKKWNREFVVLQICLVALYTIISAVIYFAYTNSRLIVHCRSFTIFFAWRS